MRLLFVENRYLTRVWEELTPALEAQGHEVHFMVQNPVFSPRMGRVHVLPFPTKGRNLVDTLDVPIKLQSDRAVRYFGISSAHYPHYQAQISELIGRINPDVIFGEPTQFHELLAIEEARKRAIPYLFPSATRYPTGRISFHIYDSLNTLGGCGQPLTESDALQMRDAIVQRRIVPSYMTESKSASFRKYVLLVVDKLRILYGWLMGERMITPAPWRKINLERKQKSLINRWESFALKSLPVTMKYQAWALYAMQMQPESNIDVWGFPWYDQVAIIRESADALGARGMKLVVKPNPKSKYELCADLCDLIESHEHIVVLSHSCKMTDVFPHASAVISVTGTVLLECVLSGKPVGVLGSHPMSRYAGVTSLASPGEIAELVDQARKGHARQATKAESFKLLSDFHAASYPGTLYDPLNQQHLATPENLAQIAEAFRSILFCIKKKELPVAK